MSLNLTERKALLHITAQCSHDDFGVFLAMHMQLALGSFSSPAKTMVAIAVDFVTWLDSNPRQLIAALEALLEEFGLRPEAPILRMALDRLKVRATVHLPTTPWDVKLVEGIPVVNRTRLRGLLQEIVDRNLPSVVQVDGPTGTGRSHSYFLIRHVATHSDVVLARVDVDRLLPESRNLPSIAAQLASELRLSGFTHPHTAGATSETIGVRYAENFATALRQSLPDRAVWLVFDSLERHRLSEVRAFIITLIDMRMRLDLGRCAFFLLGAGPEYQIDDPHRLLETETLGVFSAFEIEEYVKTLNDMGRTPLAGPVLDARSLAIQSLLGNTPEDKVCRAICSKLVDLRAEVRP
jgi:hypothetical protein